MFAVPRAQGVLGGCLGGKSRGKPTGLLGGGCVDLLAREHQSLGQGAAKPRRCRDGEQRRQHPELDLRATQARIMRGEDEMAADRELERAAQRAALDERRDGHGIQRESPRRRVQRDEQLAHLARAMLINGGAIRELAASAA